MNAVSEPLPAGFNPCDRAEQPGAPGCQGCMARSGRLLGPCAVPAD